MGLLAPCRSAWPQRPSPGCQARLVGRQSRLAPAEGCCGALGPGDMNVLCSANSRKCRREAARGQAAGVRRQHSGQRVCQLQQAESPPTCCSRSETACCSTTPPLSAPACRCPDMVCVVW
jgi:hypothetical protein